MSDQVNLYRFKVFCRVSQLFSFALTVLTKFLQLRIHSSTLRTFSEPLRVPQEIDNHTIGKCEMPF